MIKKIIIFNIRIYQRFFSRLTPTCLYTPSCSEYCILAIQKYGIKKGLKMFWERFNRCDMAHLSNWGMEDYP